MNWDIAEGKWNQMRGALRSQWGKLTDSDLQMIAGKREKLVGVLQERYGDRRDEVEKAVDEWLKKQTSSAPS